MTDDYSFQTNWFSALQAENWKKYLSHFKDRPNVLFLEVGSFEGRSAVWLLENILTHKTAQIMCIDTFEGSIEHQSSNVAVNLIERNFVHNVKRAGGEQKVIKLKGNSNKLLRLLPFNTFDFIYIDGSHVAPDVLQDAVLSYSLLKKDGIMVFDDYDNNIHADRKDRASLAVNAFLEVFSDCFKILFSGGQVIIQKIKDEQDYQKMWKN